MNNKEIEGVIILAGESPQGFAKNKLLELIGYKKHILVAAADGGALYLSELGISPDIIIGDNDSIQEGYFPKVSRLSFPKVKDFCDAEAAYSYMLQQVEGKIAVFSAFGKRPDFFLANILLPLKWQEGVERFVLFGNDCEAIYSREYVKIEGKKGDILSIIPLTPIVKGLNLEGLVYSLNNYDLVVGSTQCVSNEFSESAITIRHKQGLILIIHYIKDL